jgi:HD-GYP domain-containing protein (c-di-GMP phosphodiesterase class II)
MLRVRVGDLQPGMRLARAVPMPTHPRRFLLQRDVELTDVLCRRLKELAVAEVWVHLDELGFLGDLIDPELQEQQRQLYGNIRQNFEQVMRLSDAQLDLESLRRTVTDLFHYLRDHATGLMFLDKVQLFDNYLMAHSANVAYLSMLLGLKMNWYLVQERRHADPEAARDVITLGFGGLLHDVGKLRLPKEILDKPGRLTPDEMEEIRKHPVYGYEMVRGKVPVAAAQVVLNHHQRWDGKGYPRLKHPITGAELPPLAEKRINVFARIATLADVFDAITSKRVYSDAKPSVQALAEMLKFNRGFFDPTLERGFFEIVPAFPLGTQVKLSNGFTAAVVDFDPTQPCRPKVQPIRYPDGDPCRYPDNIEIDLADNRELVIQFVGSVDVRPYLFEAPFAAASNPASTK